MKKAINTALLVVFVLIAELACTQTVASNSNGLFLSTNNSAAAQNYISATRTDTDYEAQTIPSLATESQTITDTPQNGPSQTAVATNSIPSILDERSIPLFTRDIATSQAPILPVSNSLG